MSRFKTLALFCGIIFVVFVVIYERGPSFGFGRNWDRENWPVEFQSNGERIYFTGISSSGIRISSSGGGMHMHMHMSSCVTCHGADRQGRRLMPKFWIVAPPLTPTALFDDDDGPEDSHGDSREDSHGDHEKYNEASLRRAITRGVDPSGETLDWGMPRWNMAAQDIADLIDFLKSPAGASRSSSH